MNETIAAIATSYGIGSIAIVRVSGALALPCALKLTKSLTLKPRFAKLCEIFSTNDEFIDEGIVIYFKAPNSFSGEDVVEFQIHGGSGVAELLLGEILKCGVRLARPGEFSKRAFLNSKMDMAKAESISALIGAKNATATKILSRAMRGELAKFADSLRDELVKTLAYVETCIDYADDDLPKNIFDITIEMLERNCAKLTKIVDISQSRRGLIDGFKVAIIGKPNVGKSSILNSLLNYERAIISDEAGTTRDRIEESLKIGTHLVKIIDTAGIRKDAGAVESKGIEYSLNAASEADIILAVFDISKSHDEMDEEIVKICENGGKKVFYLLNKSDLKEEFCLNLQECIKITSSNSSVILEKIGAFLNTLDSDEIMLSSSRQICACEDGLSALIRSKELLTSGELELFAYEINLAISHIASITRPYESDEMLDVMFSSFCLGK